jgi:hypothetical protein
VKEQVGAAGVGLVSLAGALATDLRLRGEGVERKGEGVERKGVGCEGWWCEGV